MSLIIPTLCNGSEKTEELQCYKSHNIEQFINVIKYTSTSVTAPQESSVSENEINSYLSQQLINMTLNIEGPPKTIGPTDGGPKGPESAAFNNMLSFMLTVTCCHSCCE